MKQEIQNKDLMRRAVRHLLVTDDDVMNEAERIVGHTLQRENQGDNGCLTVTEIARELEMEARDLNSFLRDKGIQKWKQGQYRLTPQYTTGFSSTTRRTGKRNVRPISSGLPKVWNS